ncbi:60S ribosomal protein L12 [Camelus dromedarius]|uniref:60S ribosomal protein L12 n=1 Tax=Camelus dromedarius TaxID=9838 RepID=A0A5N4ED02_CAMDR|nr:60S ribosomal protein L12 [Camelus dromedarius]
MPPKFDPNEIKVVHLSETDHSDRQAQIEVVPSASALIIKAFKEPRDGKKQKNINHSGNISFDGIVNITQQMQH